MSKDKSTPKISDIFSAKTNDTPQSNKRTSSMLSPVEGESNAKKQPPAKEGNVQTENRTDLQLILHEFKSLKDTVDSRVLRLEAAISKQEDKLSEELQRLEDTLSRNTSKATAEIEKSVTKNRLDIAAVLHENKLLRKENDELKDRISRIESTQLCNNVILTGIPEQQWEPYEATKQRVFDTIASAHTNMNEEDRERNKRIAENTKITYCTRVGKYRPNQTRPISVTFQNKEDKDQLMQNKSKLPPGLYVNHEYPPHIKRARDRLRPLLRHAKTTPAFKDKSKLQDEYLVLNGIRYGLRDIPKLPEEMATYKAAQKTDDNALAFHGEFSPFSNFHPCKFTINHQTFSSSEQFIQYQKALMFGDSVIADQILTCDNAYEAKHLGYHIAGFDMKRWINDGYSLCYDGIHAKFTQNRNLLMMLKSTAPKVLVEATSDRLWGTGISLRDHQALNPDKWHNKGWMSTMLMGIRDESTN